MSWSQSIHSELRSSSQINIPDIQQVMPQRFLTLLTILLTVLRTNTMAHDNDNNDHDGSKLTLPRFDPKDPTYFDDLQAYAQDRGLGWLLHAEGEDTNDISKYNDMTSDQFLGLKTRGDDATLRYSAGSPRSMPVPLGAEFDSVDLSSSAFSRAMAVSDIVGFLKRKR